MNDFLCVYKDGDGWHAMHAGCGCCGGPVSLEVKDCKTYIAHLEEQLATAKQALAEMEE